MSSAVSTLSRYQSQVAVRKMEEPDLSKVEFVPKLVDLQRPRRTVMKVVSIFQWRRRFVDLLGTFVNGAISI